MAGALNVTLAKPGHYRIGEPAPEPDARHIQQANRVLYCAALLAVALAGAVTVLAGAVGRTT